MTTPDADQTASTLAETRDRLNGSWSNAAVRQVWAVDAPRLLKALEAVLKLADEWETTAATLDGGTARANALLDCTASFREAITTALTGQEAGDGR